MPTHMFARPVPSGSELRTIKPTEQPRFLQAEEIWKQRCSDAGVRYERYDPDEDEEATKQRKRQNEAKDRKATRQCKD